MLRHGPIRGGVQAVSLLTDTGKVFFEVKRGTFKAPDIAGFFERVIKRYRRYGLIILLDRAQTHRSKEIKALKEKYGERIIFEYLPAYSPELNADEQVHGYIKQHRLANRLFTRIDDLENAVINGYDEVAHRPDLSLSFLNHKDVAFFHI